MVKSQWPVVMDKLSSSEGFPKLKQIVSLNIGLKRIISDYNQGHIIRELRTRVFEFKNNLGFTPRRTSCL